MSNYLVCLALILSAVLPALSQTVTGSISGTVLDKSGSAVAAAAVTLASDVTGDKRSLQTGPGGEFVFSAVLPGRHTLSVTASGFKRFEKGQLNLTANERLSAGRIVMELGTVNESITVTADATPVQIESNERSSVLTSQQMGYLMSRGRNYTQLLTLLPGTSADDRWFEIDSFASSPTPSIGGLSPSYNGIMVDGMASHDVSNPSWQGAVFNMDAISEVKVLTNNYKAEYGRNGGAVITAVSKTGTRDYRGTAYYYQRNEALNATPFFNNLNGLRKPTYRYTTAGFTLGGPVSWPGKFNTNKDKLFFFFSEEFGRATLPGTLSQLTVPTALERAGDYSQTVDLNGRQVIIRDPSAGAAFPGNLIPKARLNAHGQKMLEMFPSPNFLDISVSKRNYNYNFQESVGNPSRQEVLRVDYNVSSKLRFYVRGATYQKHVTAYSRSEEGAQPWAMTRGDFRESNPSLMVSASYVLSPTMVYESSAGMHYRKEVVSSADGNDFASINREKLGINIPQLYPANNPMKIIPAASFGGVTNAAKLGVSNTFPGRLYQPLTTITQSLTRISGPHTLKAGLYVEFARSYRRGGADFTGTFSFARDSNNPYDTNWAYSNALLGSFYSYTESDTRPNYDLRGPTYEWYLQDTWKATRRLTIDYGMRFTWFKPYTQANDVAANLVLDRYDRNQAVQLYLPVLNAKVVRVAQHPVTGELAASTLIGAIAPGTGEAKNGFVYATDSSVPRGFVENRGVHFGPRVGFAYDVFGDGKMAFRAGAGITYQPHLAVSNFQVQNTQTKPTIFNSTLDIFAGATGALFPSSVSMLNQRIKTPTVYGYSAGIQRAIGFATVLDIAYVANLSRHLAMSQSPNTLPYGTRFLASNIDFTTRRVYSDDYLRPYIGYSTLSLPRTVSGSYHSLQAQAHRRFSRGLQFGATYTWAKAMGYTGTYTTYVSNKLNYGKTSYDRTHGVTLNGVYDLPRGSRLWNRAPMRLAFDGWQLSATAILQSGRPFAVGYSLVTSVDITGGGDFSRPIMLHAATLPHGDRTFYRFFDTTALGAPQRGDMGNAPVDAVRGPGRVNGDASIFKNFRLDERRTLVLRWEMYNFCNHPSFNAMDTTARFDSAGNQVNTRLGQLTGALTPRIMQVSLRLHF